ncbi:MAG: DNA damage-inducible protein D [Candidatus Shapirobacteria bacterium]|nr:DNA damage-inducible protein D [Candidatus Shapirobacteria bacterium]
MTNEPITIFEESKRVNQHNSEYWSARALGNILGYSEYRHFLPVIEKAKESCINSKQPVNEHFEEYLEMIKLGHGAERPISDIKLSRYACYLIMQNADPSKEVVALGQTYFAIQTRRQEIRDQTIEDNKRMFLREEVTAHNKHLAEAASMAGVRNYGIFTNYGYMGLYGGRSMVEIHQKKGLKKSQKILDFMGSEELAANLFRATQTDAKLRRDQVKNEAVANHTHQEVGREVRDTIRKLGGTMPENLPTPDAITQAKKRIKNIEKVMLKNNVSK